MFFEMSHFWYSFDKKSTICWYMVLCSLLGGCNCFEEPGWLKVVEAGSLEMSVRVCQTSWCHIREDNNNHNHSPS
jgi:hypothetical protein